MTDQQLLERRVRETLATRAEGVAATPALYERVQRGMRRAHRWGLARALAVLGAIVTAAAVAIVALPDDPTVDIVDRPPSEAPANVEPGPDTDGEGVDTAVPSDLPFGGVGYAQADDDGLTVYAPDGSTSWTWAPVLVGDDGTRSVRPIRDLAVPAGWSHESGVLAALVEGPPGSGFELALLTMLEGDRPAVDNIPTVAPDGGRIVMTPDGAALLWLEDTRLAVVDVEPEGLVDASPRYAELGLPANGPSALTAQQVVEHDDGSLTLYATDPDGREAWRLPLVTDADGTIRPEGTSMANGEVQSAGTRFPEPVPGLGAVLDMVSLPDGSTLSLEPSADGGDAPFLRHTRSAFGGFGPPGEDQVQPLPDLVWPNDGGFELDTGGGWQVTLHDGERGIVHRYLIDGNASDAESLVTARGADAAMAAVHVGADPAAWGAARDWRDELAALMEQELHEQLAEAAAAADAMRAEIAALEEQRDRAAAEEEAQEIEQQLADLRRALERQMAMVGAAQAELQARRLEESRQSPPPTDE